MSEYEVREKITDSFKELLQKDIYLIQNTTSERSITHRFATYLEKAFPGYDIDCEFNRDGLGNRPKFLELLRDKAHKMGKKRTGRVYPDIIIHKRGTQTGFIAIETQRKGEKSKDEIEFDKLKLRGYRQELGYKHTFFITFPQKSDLNSLKEVNLETFIEN